MDLVARFASLVSRPVAEVPLGEAAFVLSAHARAPFDVDAALDGIDALANDCPVATFAGLADHLFGRLGFRGNTAHYDDPDNSFLDQVLERRVGIPISLSVLMIEVGRRIDVDVVGIGMPAHFLVRAATLDPGANEHVYCDPFNGGGLLDAAGCAARFEQIVRGTRPFDLSYLAPVNALQVLLRMVANLEQGPFAHDPVRLSALLDLHLALPALAAPDRVALGAQLAHVGRFDEAARVIDEVASASPGAAALAQQARSYRARLN